MKVDNIQQFRFPVSTQNIRIIRNSFELGSRILIDKFSGTRSGTFRLEQTTKLIEVFI